MNNLGALLIKLEKYSEAEELHRKVVELARLDPMQRNFVALEAMYFLGDALYKQGKGAQAETFWKQCIDIGKTIPSQRPVKAVVASQINLGSILIERKRYEEAEKYLLEVYQMCRSRLGMQHPGCREAIECLILLYEAWNKPEEEKKYRTLLSPKEGESEEK